MLNDSMIVDQTTTTAVNIKKAKTDANDDLIHVLSNDSGMRCLACLQAVVDCVYIIYLGNTSINADNSDPIVKLNGYPLSGRCLT